jgi:hypothetical protein
MNTGIGTPEKMTEIPDSGITVLQALYTYTTMVQSLVHV